MKFEGSSFEENDSSEGTVHVLTVPSELEELEDETEFTGSNNSGISAKGSSSVASRLLL